jgi:hypothetical protein
MTRRKLTPTVTPNTLEFVIKYMLISSILDRICEMTKKHLKYRKDDTHLVILHHLLEIKTWGTKWKKQLTKHMNGRHDDG